jgi:hypothetical protein
MYYFENTIKLVPAKVGVDGLAKTEGNTYFFWGYEAALLFIQAETRELWQRYAKSERKIEIKGERSYHPSGFYTFGDWFLNLFDAKYHAKNEIARRYPYYGNNQKMGRDYVSYQTIAVVSPCGMKMKEVTSFSDGTSQETAWDTMIQPVSGY